MFNHDARYRDDDYEAEMAHLRELEEAATAAPVPQKKAAPKKTSGFGCLECGHKFRTIKAAERASFGESGCPKCGGADIDLVGSGSCAS